jgi:hypothetical protein
MAGYAERPHVVERVCINWPFKPPNRADMVYLCRVVCYRTSTALTGTLVSFPVGLHIPSNMSRTGVLPVPVSFPVSDTGEVFGSFVYIGGLEILSVV